MSDAVTRLNAALEGRYAIERKLGEGGMATVYLADDMKHNRKVALKVLKPELAAIVGAERFLSEIQVTANLTHPHILPLHDSGEADGFLFYVMPYLAGETLRDRIDREKQLPVDEAVRIATAVANALEHAHRNGVIHRDIKPANILLQDGEPVVADFGIALAVGAAGGSRLTETGLSVGTPFYMSPEQATGDQAVGASTDTYALGSVLYEMLVGEPPYPGTTAQAVLGRIIAGKPISPTEQRPSIPANVDAALRKALEKLPADRFTSADNFARALGSEHFRYGESEAVVAATAGSPWNRLSLATTASTLVLALTLGWALLRPEAPASLARFSSPFEEGQRPLPLSFAYFTADGSALVYAGPEEAGTGSQLWIRRWADLEATLIRGTEGVGTFVLSPDGREVAFAVNNGALRVVALEGGQSRPLVESVNSVWNWASDGTVYFTEAAPSLVLGRVSASGGGSEAAESVTELLAGELAHGLITLLPGEKMGVLQVYHAITGEDAELWTIDLETGERAFLTAGSTPRYVATGHLLFGTPDGVLMAAPIDVGSAELTAPPVPVADGLTVGSLGNTNYALSKNGTLIYAAGGGVGGQGGGILEPVWVTRSGVATPIDPGWLLGFGLESGLRVSPGGAQLAVTEVVDGNTDVWIKQLPDGPFERLTLDDVVETEPFWSTDGEFVTYVKNESENYDAWRRRADGTGAPQLLLDDERSLHQVRWSPDGEWMVFRAGLLLGPLGEHDIVGFRPGVDSAAVPLIASAEFGESDPALSPDGRWLAYSSNRTGRSEVYVSPFPNVDSGRVQVSRDGGQGPLWAHSGSELFFMDAERGLVAAEVETDPGFRVLQRVTLFTFGAEYGPRPAGVDFYDVAPDDQQFVMLRLAVQREDGDSRFILVQNFFQVLQERVGN